MFVGIVAYFTAESFMLKECLLVSRVILQLRVLCEGMFIGIVAYFTAESFM